MLDLDLPRVFFLGAGFSAPAGVPIAANLLPHALREVRSCFPQESKLDRGIDNYLAFREATSGADDSAPIDLEKLSDFLAYDHFLGLRGSKTWSEEGNEDQLMLRWAVGAAIHHLTPMASELPELYLEFARSLRPRGDNAERDGVYLISYDRPGYGGSTVLPERSIADCAGDVRAIASALGIDRLAVWGFSGGGPHALACAALLEDLVCAVATFSTLAPYGEPGLDWFDKMGTENADDARLALVSPNSARQGLVNLRAQLPALTSEQVEVRARRLPSAEASALPYYRWWLMTNLKEAFAPGLDGKWDEI